MTPKRFTLVAIVLASASIAFEAAALSGLVDVGTDAYHSIHVALMAALVISQFALFLHGRGRRPEARLALFFAVGAAFTMVGDFFNGAVSGVEPVSHKLTWALLWFGTGYVLYVAALWMHNEPILRQSESAFAKYRYAFVLPVLAVNVAGWLMHVGPNVEDFELLRYGSFVFNATIYVALPVLGLWFFRNTGWSAGGLVVLIGAIFIPYSDLVLFSSWLGDGDPAVPSFRLYAYNWIVYFTGQVMVAVFPALAMSQAHGEAGQPAEGSP